MLCDSLIITAARKTITNKVDVFLQNMKGIILVSKLLYNILSSNPSNWKWKAKKTIVGKV